MQVRPLRDPSKFQKIGPKIRAILHEHGRGNVAFAAPWPTSVDNPVPEEFLKLLGGLNYRKKDTEYVAQSIAKFGFVNKLTPITVFPAQIGCNSLRRLAMRTTYWEPYRDNLAFFLPVSSPPKPTFQKTKKYGTMLAKQVYDGGGPFLIQDSEMMVAEALTRMGYLDELFNTDLPEALLTFTNMPRNKLVLRKYCNALPYPTDTAADVEHKLRRAFMSHDTSGNWRVAPKDAAVRRKLCKIGFLAQEVEPKAVVLQAMRDFSRSRNLEEMCSYNGNVFQILRYMGRSDASQTGTVDFRR